MEDKIVSIAAASSAELSGHLDHPEAMLRKLHCLLESTGHVYRNNIRATGVRRAEAALRMFDEFLRTCPNKGVKESLGEWRDSINLVPSRMFGPEYHAGWQYRFAEAFTDLTAHDAEVAHHEERIASARRKAAQLEAQALDYREKADRLEAQRPALPFFADARYKK